MAEQILSQKTYLNQFKTRNLSQYPSIISISSDISSITQTVDQIFDSFTLVTQSIIQVSQSLEDKNIILNELSSTANSLNPNKVFVNKEIPSGSINGINTTYTLSHSPTQGSDHLYLNGLLIEEGSLTDYAISGSTIIFNEPLPSGSKIHCTYYYLDLTPLRVFNDKESPSGVIDGINKIFTLRYSPVENSEHVYLNGLLQENGNNGDYEINDSIITFKEPPPIGVKLRCTYYYIL